MPNETHLVRDAHSKFTPRCEFTLAPPQKWPCGHDMTGDPANVTCPYCKKGEKHPNAPS